MGVRPFDIADFRLSPGKYRMFRTARIVEAVHEFPGLQVGQLVGVAYVGDAFNDERAVVMPRYAVVDREGGVSAGVLFASVLGDFSL